MSIGDEIVGPTAPRNQGFENDVATAAEVSTLEFLIRQTWRARRAALVKELARVNRTSRARPHPFPPKPAVLVHSGQAAQGDPGHLQEQANNIAASALDPQDLPPLTEAGGFETED